MSRQCSSNEDMKLHCDLRPLENPHRKHSQIQEHWKGVLQNLTPLMKDTGSEKERTGMAESQVGPRDIT